MNGMARALAGVLLLGVLGACASEVNRAGNRGDFAAVVQQAQESDEGLSQYTMEELHTVCESFLSMRMFDQFHDCADTLDRRIADNGGHFRNDRPPTALWVAESALTMNDVYSQNLTALMRAEAYLYSGDLEKSHDHADRVAAALTGNEYSTIHAESGIGSLFGSGYESFTTGDRIKALGIAGVVEAEWRDADAALARARTIEEQDTAGFSAAALKLSDVQSLWLARIYSVAGDHAAAYEAMTREQEASAGAALWGALMLVNQVNPARVMTLSVTGTLDFDDMSFATSFEPRFMLHRAELETGRLAEAKAGYDDILAEPRVKGFGSVYWQALHGRGRIALAEGDLAGAIGYFERAVRVIEAQRRSIESEAGRMSFAGDKQEVYRDLIGALIDSGRVAEAFAFAERGKARALVDILASKESFGANLKPQQAALLSRYQREEDANRAAARTQGVAIGSRSFAARSSLIAQAPELASLVTVEALTAAELQALIPAGETLVEYYREGDSLFAFVVDRNRVQAFRLDGAGLEAAVSRFRREVARAGSDGWRRAGGRLHAILIAPLADAVTTERVMLVPHGALHYLPWSAIPTPAGGFLLDDWEVSILPSASVLRFIEPAPAAGSLLAVGNPDLGDPKWDLPGAEAEAVAISRAAGKAETLLRRRATETAVRQRGPSHGVLHLASHGVFDPRSPLSSALLMARDGQNDGRLTASEIYELDLKASLVTLSACETGLGRVQSGDDVVGLTRGFLFSGANAIVSSLWLVDDAATSDLMQAFYAARGEVGAAAALRQAQLRLRRSGKDHPYYWAAFQITGRENLSRPGA